MSSLRSINEQVIVITGASSGIGRETAMRAAQSGARLVLAARGSDGLMQLERELREQGGAALAVAADVADEAQVEHVADQAVKTFGGIDTWVNDAAVSAYAHVNELSIEEYRRIFDVNIMGTLFGIRAALPRIEARGGGVIVCIGSVLSDRAVPLQGAYCASKHAVKALTESLRAELLHAGSPVKVSLIKPSSIGTPFFDHALSRTGRRPKPVPPVYDPALVALSILHAAEHGDREIVVGGGGKMITTLEAFAGPVLDHVLARVGESGQKARAPKAVTDPNNLFTPMPDSERGSYRGRRLSAYTWMRLHPRAALGGMAAVAVAGSAIRRARS